MKANQLEHELENADEYWKNRHADATKATETAIRKNENENHVKRIEKAILEIKDKEKKISALNKERDALKKEASEENSNLKDKEVKELREKLNALEKNLEQLLNEKNKHYDDLAKAAKDLMNQNDQIQKNSTEIAELTNELALL